MNFKGKGRKNKGITLIALVITVIVLLILAGVSLAAIFGQDGILNKAQEAKDDTNVANEKEAIEFYMLEIQTEKMRGEEKLENKYLGEKLSEMSVTTDWKNVIVGEKIYKDGWYLLERNAEISGYGKTKLNWLINYDSGELLELEDGKYTVASANASGAIVDETLRLNIDPSNIQNASEWGKGVSFIGGQKNDENSGVKETEIKFDGIDDYLKIENINVEKSNGITFEFYGKSDGSEYSPLNKTYFNGNNIELARPITTSFRIKRFQRGGNNINCCFGKGNSGSDRSGQETPHWMNFEMPRNENFEYFTITIDFPKIENDKGIIRLYYEGTELDHTTCNKEYLNDSDIFNSELPFTVGLVVSAKEDHSIADFSKFDLYACRLYTRVLDASEIRQNFIATTDYHNRLLSK